MQLKQGLAALALAATVFSAPAGVLAAELEVGGDIGVFNQYVWRGVTQTNGAAAVQGDLGVSTGGLSAGLWFSNAYPSAAKYANRDVVEFDWTVDYSGSTGDLGYSVGTIYYSYLYDGLANFNEIYAGVSYDGPLAPSLTVYYTVTDGGGTAYLKGDMWIDLGVSASALGADLGATLSYASWASDVGRAAAEYEDGLSVLALSASKDAEVGDLTVTPSLTLSVPLSKKDAADIRYIYGTQSEVEVVAGLNVAF